MDDSLYDEFGNYIGPEVEQSEEPQYEEQEEDQEMYNNDIPDTSLEEPSLRRQVVLHENKEYYPSAEVVYGKEVEALVQEEDTQPLSEPILAPPKIKKFQILEKQVPKTHYKTE